MKGKLCFIKDKLSVLKKSCSHIKKKFSQKADFILDDKKYKKYFECILGPKIYLLHLNENYICCNFCSHLKKSTCHDFCFVCSKGTYNECSNLLPGTFSFAGSYFDSLENNCTPWIFKTPCTSFERLDCRKYFKNFVHPNKLITVANYESLEGLFLGICRGKRPCHICASVNMEIFAKCSQDERTAKNTPCYRIIDELSAKYQAALNMIMYFD